MKVQKHFSLQTPLGTSLPKETVYGKRDGVLNGLAIVNKDPRNQFRGVRGFKTGAVHGVKMCSRANMFKPEQAIPQKYPWRYLLKLFKRTITQVCIMISTHKTYAMFKQ